MRNLEVNVVKRLAVPTHYVDVCKGEQRFRSSVQRGVSSGKHPAMTGGNDSFILTQQGRAQGNKGSKRPRKRRRLQSPGPWRGREWFILKPGRCFPAKKKKRGENGLVFTPRGGGGCMQIPPA